MTTTSVVLLGNDEGEETIDFGPRLRYFQVFLSDLLALATQKEKMALDLDLFLSISKF